MRRSLDAGRFFRYAERGSATPFLIGRPSRRNRDVPSGRSGRNGRDADADSNAFDGSKRRNGRDADADSNAFDGSKRRNGRDADVGSNAFDGSKRRNGRDEIGDRDDLNVSSKKSSRIYRFYLLQAPFMPITLLPTRIELGKIFKKLVRAAVFSLMKNRLRYDYRL